MPGEIDEAKRALRTDLRKRRNLLSPGERAAAESSLTVRLDELIAAHSARAISCFCSTDTEPGTRPFIEGALARGVRVLLPIAKPAGRLEWAAADAEAGTVRGRFGLREPAGDVLGPTALDEVDLMLIPAAAVDRTGMRLGWGRGYFDRTLESIRPGLPVYAIVYDTEILDRVPRDVHDQPVPAAVTPLRTLYFSPI